MRTRRPGGPVHLLLGSLCARVALTRSAAAGRHPVAVHAWYRWTGCATTQEHPLGMFSDSPSPYGIPNCFATRLRADALWERQRVALEDGETDNLHARFLSGVIHDFSRP